MARTPREPAIVAELGRPETPEETAARKAENSRRHRGNQTVRNLVLSLLASLGIVLFLVLVVARPNSTPSTAVDFAQVAAEAQPSVAVPLTVPVLPAGWSANAAELSREGETSVWRIGFITPDQQFISVSQAIAAPAGWAAVKLGSTQATGNESIAGVMWDSFDRRESEDAGNYAFALTATINGSSILLNGTATDAEFALLAAAVVESLGTP